MSNLANLMSAIRGSATPDEAEDVLALLLLRDPASLEAEGRDLLTRFSKRSGVDLTLETAALETGVEAYLLQHPLNPAVLASLKTVAQALTEQHGPTSADVQAALNLVGTAGSNKPLGGGERPAGTVPAGPLARFQTDARKK